MSDSRIIEETPCPDCGKPAYLFQGPSKFHWWNGKKCSGPGGSRRVLEVADLDGLIGEVGLRLLRRVNSGETLTPERATTEMLNVFDEAGGRIVREAE